RILAIRTRSFSPRPRRLAAAGAKSSPGNNPVSGESDESATAIGCRALRPLLYFWQSYDTVASLDDTNESSCGGNARPKVALVWRGDPKRIERDEVFLAGIGIQLHVVHTR